MKLAATFFTMTMATCPTDWSAGLVAGACVPDGVTVTCTDSTMEVEFLLNHVYEDGSTELDASQIASALAHVSGSSDTDCMNFAYDPVAGTFTAIYSIDDCTSPAHDTVNGYLTFTNSIVGDEAALLRDGIITTKILSFEAQCRFADTATVTVDGITVNPSSNIVETTSAEGIYTFQLESYVDSLFTTIADSTNKIEIGDPVYNKVYTNDVLPAAVQYHVTDCMAWETYDSILQTGADGSYTIFEDNDCESELIDTAITGNTGDNVDPVTFHFNSFTFDAAEDSVNLVCDVKLCLSTETGCFEASTGCTTGYSASAP